MNSTLSWTAVLNQNGGWRLGAHQGSLHYTAPDRGSRVEKGAGRKGKKKKEGKKDAHEGPRVSKEEGVKRGEDGGDSLRWVTQNGREERRKKERETRGGKGVAESEGWMAREREGEKEKNAGVSKS